MKLYKLINGCLISAPATLVVNGETHAPVSDAVLIAEGYKPLTTADRQPIEWFERYAVRYVEESTTIREIVDIAPLDGLKNAYISRLNNECDAKIVSGFVFTDASGVAHPVWLSMENQFNFSQVEVPCELKLGQEDWIDLTAQNELTRFKKEVKQYITSTLQACWQPKKAIKGMTDAQVYTYLKTL